MDKALRTILPLMQHTFLLCLGCLVTAFLGGETPVARFAGGVGFMLLVPLIFIVKVHFVLWMVYLATNRKKDK